MFKMKKFTQKALSLLLIGAMAFEMNTSLSYASSHVDSKSLTTSEVSEVTSLVGGIWKYICN